MKALKDCKFTVHIEMNYPIMEFYWIMLENKDSGIFGEIIGDLNSQNKEEAKADFIRFAELNGITNYEFVEG